MKMSYTSIVITERISRYIVTVSILLKAGFWTVERLIDAEGKYSSKTIVYSPVVRGHIFKPTRLL